MEGWFIYGGIALCTFSLWALIRHDWLRLARSKRKVIGRVTGHRASLTDADKSYAPIYAFSDETGEHEVIDQVYGTARKPDVGAMIELSYPAGRPDLARPPRPIMWWAVYGGLAYGLGILAAKAMGLIGD